jgi:hypothetical protein
LEQVTIKFIEVTSDHADKIAHIGSYPSQVSLKLTASHMPKIMLEYKQHQQVKQQHDYRNDTAGKTTPCMSSSWAKEM